MLTAAAVGYPASVLADDAQSTVATAVDGVTEEIIVTGSNVRGAPMNTMVDLQVLDRAVIEQTGARQVSDLLANVPANTGSQLYNETGQLSGTAQFVLRGLGFASTLTLLNGRRAGVSPLSDKSGADFVDINQFPLLMIERVDVLKDGASAIYGSDAVAGVVNLVTRKRFDGLDLSTDYAGSSNDAYSVSAAAGRTFDRGSLSAFATYYRQSGNVRSDFDWIMERLAGNGVPGRSQLLTSNSYPGNYARAAFTDMGQPTLAPGATAVADPNCEAAGGVFRINNDGSVNRNTCYFDYHDQIAVVPEQQRLQAFVQGEFEITERVRYFNESSASENENLIYKQPGSYSNGLSTGNAAGNIYVPAESPFNFFVADASRPGGIAYIDPAQWDPSVHQAVPLVGNFRPQGIHFSGDKQQTNTYLRSVNGLDIGLGGDWQMTISHAYAHARYDERDPVRMDSRALNRLLLEGRYNPFATSITDPTLVSPKDGVSVAGNSQDVIDQIFYTAEIERRTHQQVVDLSASGPVLTLPIGEVSLAVGAQYREQSLKSRPDALALQGLADSPATDQPYSASADVLAGYAEVVLPINDLAMVQAAVRHEDHGGSVGSSTDPKIAGRLNLFSGALALRGSWGTSFQAPTLTQGATSQAFVVINDPVVMGPNGLTCGRATSGNNVNVVTFGGGLEPQQATNYNFGVDWRPFEALTLGAGYWHYDYSELIAAGQNGQAIVNGECVNGVYVPDPRAVRGSGGQLFQINTEYENVGKVVTDGVDLSAMYRLSTDRAGDWLFRTEATRVNRFDVYGANGAVSRNVGSRNFNNNFAPMPEWRAFAQAVWSGDVHELSLAVRYTDGYKNDQSNNAPIDSFTTADLQYRLTLEELVPLGSSEFTVGVSNLFDRDPPSLVRYDAAGQLISGTTSDIDRPGYDPLSVANIQGRSIYLRFLQKL